MTDDDFLEAKAPPSRRRGCGSVLLTGVGIVALGLGLLWWQRTTIAQDALDRALADRGVPARYRVTAIGTKWQRIENVVLGDPHAPDLTADWAEVQLSAGFGGVTAKAVRAGGVRLHGRLTGDGQLTLGALDKLLPKSAPGTPLKLPAIDLALRDARMLLDTPYGVIGARLDGAGNLANGFAGKVAGIMPALNVSGCRGEQFTAVGDVTSKAGALAFKGPVRMTNAQCRGVMITKVDMLANGTLGTAFDSVNAALTVKADVLRSGTAKLAVLSGDARLNGAFNALLTEGTFTASTASYGNERARDVNLHWVGQGANASGTLAAAQVSLASLSARVRSIAGSVAQLPFGPALSQLESALARAGDTRASADWRYDGHAFAVANAKVSTGSGATMSLSGGTGLRLASDAIIVDSNLDLRGGGFPTITGPVRRRPNSVTTGLLSLAPYGPAGRQVALAPVRFAMQPTGAWLVETNARIDGPLPGGAVQGLTLPVALFGRPDGALVLNGKGCTPVSVGALTLSSLNLGTTRFNLCPTGGALYSARGGKIAGGGRISAPRLSGRLGTAPFALTARDGRYDLADGRFALNGGSVILGNGKGATHLNVARLTGTVRGGRFEGLAGSIGDVPLLISQASGPWRYDKGVLSLSGSLGVADAAQEPRFMPLISKDVAFRLADNRIAATATLVTPTGEVPVTRVTINHALGPGSGNAVLDVPSLKFNRALKPEDLAPVTKGVVQNVEGEISGRGDVIWDARGVRSSGAFQTGDSGLNLAAAFGPVQGLHGKIVFDDLLALATPPGQAVTIVLANPGVPVAGGQVRYQLLPNSVVVVEGGSWPLSGGTLTLEPARLDFGQPVKRRLTFNVEALEAAKFVQDLQFENFAATGTFDGSLPIVFDANGGQIEGGVLKVRDEGGTLAYVGDVSNAKMNRFAQLAFDALKSMRYRDLTIELNGALDGEIVSLVRFNGVNRSPIAPAKGFLTRQFLGLPFRFNITIKAPFRGLLSTAKSFTDSMMLINRARPIPDDLPGQEPVKPAESEPKR